MSKYNQVRKLVQSLCRKHTPAIYVGNIADRLQLPVELIEAELHRMVEEDIFPAHL